MGKRAAIAGVIAAALCLPPLVPLRSETMVLTSAELRTQAILAAGEGRIDAALYMARALLSRMPRDVAANLVLSAALRDMGDWAGARDAARVAWQAADNDADRYRAALLTSQALASMGRRTEAQLWLRRAAELAPNETAYAVARRDFNYVRSRNPLSVDLSFSVAPSSNINNGSTADIVWLFGFPFTLSGASKALSGLRVAGGAELTWRFPPSATTKNEATLSFYHQTYVMSPEAKAIAPTSTGSDFAYSSLAATFRQEAAEAPGWGLFGWDITVGRDWYGGAVLSDFIRYGNDMTRQTDAGNKLVFGSEIEMQFRPGTGDTAASLLLESDFERPLEGGARLGYGLSAKFSESGDSSLDFTSVSAEASYRPAQTIWNANVTVSAGAEWRRYTYSPYKTGGREDISASLGVELLFAEQEHFGFAPTVSLVQSVQFSDVDLYDSRATAIQVGFKSLF